MAFDAENVHSLWWFGPASVPKLTNATPSCLLISESITDMFINFSLFGEARAWGRTWRWPWRSPWTCPWQSSAIAKRDHVSCYNIRQPQLLCCDRIQMFIRVSGNKNNMDQRFPYKCSGKTLIRSLFSIEYHALFLQVDNLGQFVVLWRKGDRVLSVGNLLVRKDGKVETSHSPSLPPKKPINSPCSLL